MHASSTCGLETGMVVWVVAEPAMAGTAAAVMAMAKDAGVGVDVAVVPGRTWWESKYSY